MSDDYVIVENRTKEKIERMRKEAYYAEIAYEESIVNLFLQAYKDARGCWPHAKLEEALYEAVRGNLVR